MSTPDIERPDIVEQARAALSDWHEACARMDEVDADPDLEHEDRRHAQDIVTEAALETAWLMADLVAEADRLRGQLDRARDFAARLEADGARLVERIEGMIAERLAEVDLRPTPYAAGVRNCARSVLDILAEHRLGRWAVRGDDSRSTGHR